MPKRRGPNEDEVFNSLFKGVKAITSIPLERKSLMRKVERKLKLALLCVYAMLGVDEVETRRSRIKCETYLNTFGRNLFDCLGSCQRYFHDSFRVENDIPQILYHGTTTKLLPEIIKKGLLPSKTGLCWAEDKGKYPKETCLTDVMYGAEMFAVKAAFELGGKPVVLFVNIKGLEDKMRFTFEIGDYQTVFDMYKEMCFQDPIPPQRIIDWYFPPKIPAAIVLASIPLSPEDGALLLSKVGGRNW